jgi:hypothetical protein
MARTTTTKNSRGTYYKAQRWDERSLSWRDIQRAFASPEEARASFGAEGSWRVMEITPRGRAPYAG